MSLNEIEKEIFLRAPKHRVWKSLVDAAEFGSWFGVRFEDEFREGTTLIGRVVPTTVDAQMAEEQKAYEGLAFEIQIDQINPEVLFSFRWHPYALEPDRDYSSEPTTLITFTLQETDQGTLVKICETGFEGIPLDRRAKAFEMNDIGWQECLVLLQKYVEPERSWG